MFWGLLLEPKKRYLQKVEIGFHLSQAVLDISTCDNEPVKVLVRCDGRNYLLCILQKPGIVQCSLDLNFSMGTEICFSISGKGVVHLSGYLVEEESKSEIESFNSLGKRQIEPPASQIPKKKSRTEVDDSDSDFENALNFEPNNLKEDDKEDDDDDDDVDDEEAVNEEIDNNEDEDEYEEQSDVEFSDSANEDESSTSGDEDASKTVAEKKSPISEEPVTTKKGKKKLNLIVQKQPKERKQMEQNNADKASQQSTPNSISKNNSKDNTSVQVETNRKQTLEGGVLIQDLTIGDGPLVKVGKTVQVYYEGRLKHNNRMFDSVKQGPGFKFKIGKQQVIKGWEVGVVGMKVGGKRRISCPPRMAYGQKGSPPVIPPNATLIFEIEIKNVL